MDDRHAPTKWDYNKCKEDFVIFCESCVKLYDPCKKGLRDYKLYDFQKRFAQHIKNNKFTICKKFRQGGFTTLSAHYLLWQSLFHDKSSMVLCKTEREAMNTCETIKRTIDWLPEELKNQVTRNTNHEIRFDHGGSILFGTYHAACGRSIDCILFDEIAFWNNAKEAWLATYPCFAHPNGEALIVSTVNGTGNWFHKTYTDAEQGNNKISIFKASYTESPDFKNPNKVAELKKNLGEIGWQQEMLCNFEPVAVLNGIHDEKKAHLLFDKERNETSEQPVLRDVIHLKDELTRGQIKSLYNYYFKRTDPKPRTAHPDIAENLNLSSTEDMSEFWNMVAETIPEDPDYKKIAESWIKEVQRKNDRFAELEHKIADLGEPDLLKLAGVEDDTEDVVVRPPARDEVRKEIIESSDLPRGINLDFSQDYVMVNKLPTNIPTVFLKNAYIGLAGLLSHERAVRIISKIIKKRLNPLFGRDGK